MGHLVRSLALAEGLADEFRVVLLNGGRFPKRIVIPRNIEVINLPPLGLAENNELVSHDCRRSVARAQDMRKKILLDTLNELQPAIILIELFPFGRKKFAGELLSLLKAARSLRDSRPLIVCSLRDILVGRHENQQKYDDRAASIANEYFDLVLVHSDPSFARLEESFHPRTQLCTPVAYTGFVVPPLKSASDPKCSSGFKKIVVSAGGGMVGEPLLRAAIQAHGLFSPDEKIEMDIIAGLFLPERSWRALRELAKGKQGLRLRRHVADLCGEMRKASASVSQCGYNTSLDILRAGVPALVVPFAVGNEDEQLTRALLLKDLGAIRVLEESDINPERMAAEIRELLAFRALRPMLDLEGVDKSVRILKSMIGTSKSIPVIPLPESTNLRRVNA
jgi:predicted glycosyltransferase